MSERAIDSLIDLASMQNRSIEALRETIQEARAETNSSIDNLATEVTKLAVNVGQMNQGISELRKAIDGHLIVAREQSANISQLIDLAKQQQATVEKLLSKN